MKPAEAEANAVLLARVRLLHLASPATPVGSYAYSQGLEWACHAGWVRYQQDPVLDQMLLSLGLRLKVEKAPFQPETGAYGPRHSHEAR